MSFSEKEIQKLAEYFISELHVYKKRKTTIYGYKRAVHIYLCYIKHAFDNNLDINTDNYRLYLQKRHGYSLSTINYYFKIANKFNEYCFKHGVKITEVNFYTKFGRNNSIKSNRATLIEGQFLYHLVNHDVFKNKWHDFVVKAAIVLISHIPLPISAIVNLKWSDISFIESGVVININSNIYNIKGRYAEILMDMRRTFPHHFYVFGFLKPISYTWIYLLFKKSINETSCRINLSDFKKLFSKPY
ncbi:MAG: hypothetical protein NZM04_00830 [Methylacidiphilales bacterium]|nr:hypothetical protein [Candidatus Methylacidiphilales bacterium]